MQDINILDIELQSKYYTLLHNYYVSNHYDIHKQIIKEINLEDMSLKIINDKYIKGVYNPKYRLLLNDTEYYIAYCFSIGLCILDFNFKLITNVFSKHKEFSIDYINFVKGK